MKNLKFVLFSFVLAVLIASCGKQDSTEVQTGNKTPHNTTNTTTTPGNDTANKKQDGTETAKDIKDTLSKKVNESLTDKDKKSGDGDIVNFETTMGNFKVKLYSDKAPITTGNFKELVKKGFYNGIIFHRVIDGFMIQAGDPTGTGRGGSGKTIPDEFGPGLKHDKKGILSMANAGPNTGSSQFFVTLVPTPHLDGKHAIFGEVIQGMDVVEKIGKTKTGQGDRPVQEVKMTKVTLASK